MSATALPEVPRAAAPPAAARAVRGAEAVTLDYRPSYKAAGVVALLVFGLYVLTLAPSTAMWDASEYIAAAYVLGIPHPPGNPFFMLIGRVFSILPIAPNVAMRINVLAALCSAVAAGVWFLVAERVTVRWLTRRWQRIATGTAAALIGATSFTVWNQSVVNEKVYTVALAFFAVVSWLVLRWCDDPHAPRANRLLILAAYLIGLGYTNHPAGLLVGPAVAAGVLLRKPSTLLNGRLLAGGALAFGLGLTPFAYLPIRAAQFPAINEGEPTACAVKLELSCTFSRVTVDRTLYHINRRQYPVAEGRQAPFTAQVDMWWTYFRWQWIRDAYGEHRALQSALAVLFLGLGLVGGYAHWKRDRQSFWFFGPLVFSVTLALVFYMNFKYGATQAPELGDGVEREVRDRDYFYLWSFSTWGVWAALGLVWAWESVAAMLGRERITLGRETVDVPTDRGWKLASPVMAVALIPLVTNWEQASRAGHRDTGAFARDLLNSVEPYGVLVTAGDNDMFPLWYAQEVEGVRRDVLIANTSLMNTDWYPRQMVRRPVYAYDAARGPAVYRGRRWPKPSGSPLRLSIAEVDAIPLGVVLQEPQTFRKVIGGDTLTATITQPQLLKADLLVLYMIRDAWPGRPIYFSRTTGTYGLDLGLEGRLLTQGLARKLVTRPITPSRDTVAVPGEGFVDLPRTTALWNASEGPGALIARGGWVDPPSVNIPNLYTMSGLQLADALERTGRAAEARAVYATAEGVARATRQTRAFGFDRRRQPVAPNDDVLQNLVPTAPDAPPMSADSPATAGIPPRRAP